MNEFVCIVCSLVSYEELNASCTCRSTYVLSSLVQYKISAILNSFSLFQFYEETSKQGIQ